ncbi:MAG: DUF3267 domain-containing protein [Chloroflexi bacterium]|nr:DUF3267 domain-containing protein [Chloroflexota bacterium]MCC6893393.1 DUF3267 domain-containing protein [Anaerolineae bacterium]
MQSYDPSKLRDVSVPLKDIASAGLMLLSLVLAVVPLIPHVLRWGFEAGFNGQGYLLGVIAFVVLIIAHEGMHALGWILFAGVPASAIRFGIMWKTLSPYAHSTVAMRASGYRVGVILPLIFTGILPVIVGTALNLGWLTAAGAVLVSGAIGDLLVLWVIRAVPGRALVIDHPEKPGCYVVEDSFDPTP